MWKQIDQDATHSATEIGLPPTGSVRTGLWRSSGLVDTQHPAEAGPGKTFERGRVPQVPGPDLDEGVLTAETSIPLSD